MADKKKMSVAEILAAARKSDNKSEAAESASAPPVGSGEGSDPVDSGSAAPEPSAAAPAAEEPAKALAAAKPKTAAGGRPSVAEMMAMARAAKGGAAPAESKPAAKAEKPKAEKPAKPAAAAKPAATAKPAAEKSAAPGASAGPPVRETSSILAAARAASKPGPMSKSEAAARQASDSPKAKAAPVKGVVPPMPAKPEAAKPKAGKAAPASEDRRWFVGMFLGSFLAVGFTSLATTFSLWTLGFARFMFPNILTEPPSKFKVGFPSDFPPGNVEEKFKAQFGVWVVNAEYQGQPQLYALKTVCTHLGCTPNWLDGEQKFKCPCHGSGFYKDGINFEGPAPRPLERYAIRLADDGQLEIDKSKLFLEEKGEWSSPACFVPA